MIVSPPSSHPLPSGPPLGAGHQEPLQPDSVLRGEFFSFDPCELWNATLKPSGLTFMPTELWQSVELQLVGSCSVQFPEVLL